MIKNIYGIYDAKTRNFGDICILDRDEEFRDGCIELFSNPDIPEYITHDLIGVCYGTISFDSGDAYPHFFINEIPKIVVSGFAPTVISRRDTLSKVKGCDNDEETEKDS